MRRLLLVLVLWLGLLASFSQAEYLLIKIDLNTFVLGPPKAAGGGVGVVPMPPTGSGSGAAGTTGPLGPPPLWAYALLELQKSPQPFVNMYGKGYSIEHRLGKGAIPLAAIAKGLDQPSAAKRFEERRKRESKEGKAPDKMFLLAEWALTHGLQTEFVKMMEDLAKVDAKHPAVVALDTLKQQMKRAPTVDDPAASVLMADLRSEDYRPVQSEQGHYTLLTKLPSDEAVVKNHLARLEGTYQNFFTWFALKGKVLPLPKYRLVAVLESTPKEFQSKYVSFDAPPMVGDGFTAKRDNVIFVCAKPLDEAYTMLEKNNQTYWQTLKVSRDELLSGGPSRQLPINPTDLPVLSTLTLVQRVLEDDSERATLTHEGVRQLLAATGLLPRNVMAAEWVQYGLASFFDSPRQAPHPGTALPSWTHLIDIKYLRNTSKLPADQSKEIVLNVVTDTYFRQAYALWRQQSDNKELLEPKVREELDKARATAWALTYYLMQQRMDSLFTYLQEVSDLPRDVEYDANVLQGCFGRAFGLAKDDPTNPNQVDPAKVQNLANSMFRAIENTHLDIEGFEQEALRARSQPPPAKTP